MFSQLGPVEMRCEAPPYPVVRACARLGLRTPLDVRWCHLNQFLGEHAEPQAAIGRRLWRWLWGRRKLQRTCTCGEPLPRLERYPLAEFAESEGDFLLGQCQRCQTIFWEIRITHRE
jgi:hypothetical protein